MIKIEHALNLVTAIVMSCAYFDFLNAPRPDMSDVATLCVSTR